MSAFLGPIHYWLYNKIKVQEQMVEVTLDAVANDNQKEAIRKEIYNKYGMPLEGDLEAIIDTGNIHGWLQERLTEVEYKWAYVVTTLLKEKLLTLEEMQAISRQLGFEAAKGKETVLTHPQNSYQAIFDALVEGMPCDRINEVKEVGEDSIQWEQAYCIHKKYWDEVGGEIEYFYQLRSSWIEGFLKGTGMIYKREGHTQSIRRG